MEPQKLIKKIDDRDAVSILIGRYGNKIYARLYDRLHDKQLADEAFRKTVFSFLETVKRLENDDLTEALFSCIADNVCREVQESADTVDENTVFAALKAAGTIPQETSLLSFRNDGGALTLDMSAEFASLVGTMGTSGEYMLLGSVVNTYLTAFDAQTVTLLSNGNPLETGHNVYFEPMGFFEDNAA